MCVFRSQMMVIWLIFEKGTFYHLIQGSVTNLQNTPEFAYVILMFVA